MYFTFVLLLLAPMSFASNPTVEDIIERHLEALGGAERWAAVRTMKITGTYEAFSAEAPFTIYRKRPDFYRFERTVITFGITSCYDGEQAWWVNPMMGPPGQKPAPIFKPQHKIALREKEFECVLFDYRKKGHQVTLEGKEAFEGQDHYKLKVVLADGPTETWFINSKTFLKTAMIGEGYEYGRKVVLDVFYDDYRKVDGMVFPFYVEQEYHTRHRVFTLDKVELNIPIDETLFRMPEQEKKKE